MITVGVIGYGYWGPNLVRNFAEVPGGRVGVVTDLHPARLSQVTARYPATRVSTDHRDVINDPSVDAVAIATPVSAHFDLAMAALRAGKHVLVEKPMTATSEQSMTLIDEAEKRGLVLMVDHTFVYTAAVRKIADLIAGGELGRVLYLDSVRINLGLFQPDYNVIWDLAPHDLSIMNHLLPKDAEAISATGESHLNGHEDIAFITAYYPDKMIAHVNVNWISPVKVRTTLIGGEKKMLVWNDLEADEKLKIYDKGVDVKSQEGVYNLLVSYRSGDMWAPQVEQVEALRLELRYFVECITRNEAPFNNGCAGLKVVRMLEAASQSLAKRGALVYV